MKNIEWSIGGLEIPNIGITEIGKSIVVLNNEIADSLIFQGIAKEKKKETNEKSKIIKGGQ